MYERIERIKSRVVIDHYPICIEKFRITLEARKKYRNLPIMVQRGKILEEIAEKMPIGINEDELIVGMAASKPMGLEIDPDYGIWEQDEIDSLKEDGYLIDLEDEEELQKLNREYVPATLINQMGNIFYENERLISVLEAGLCLPPWKPERGSGVGGGYAQSGLGLGPSLILLAADYTKLLHLGADELIRQINPEARVVCEAERLRPGKSEVERLLGDASKLRALTGWQPAYTFEQGLAQTIEWLRGNMDGYKVDAYNL